MSVQMTPSKVTSVGHDSNEAMIASSGHSTRVSRADWFRDDR